MKILEKKLNLLYKLIYKLGRAINNWGTLIILIISLIFFYPVLLQNKIPLPLDALVGAHVPWTEVNWDGYPAGVPIKNLEITDAISQFYPWKALAADFWRAGKFPLWNQYMFNGAPFLATLHSQTMYPLNFLFLIFSTEHAWSILIFLQVFVSGLFMILFLKELGLKNHSVILGASAFMFCGYMISWLEFATGGQAGLWLPLVLYLTLKMVRSNFIVYPILISSVYFFIFTAGDFQIPFYIVLIYLSFGLYLTIFTKVREKLRSFVRLISALGMGVLLSAIQLFPTFDLFRDSQRANDPYIKEFTYGLLDWQKIVNFIWPDFFGNNVTGNYWSSHTYHEYIAYTGIITLLFAVFSFFNHKKDAIERYFWVLFFTSLLFLFPTPLGFLPYKLNLSGLSTSSASRLIFISNFSLSTLGAYGFSKLNKININRLIKVIFYFLVVTSGLVLGLITSYYVLVWGNREIASDITMIQNLKVTLKNLIPQTGLVIIILVMFGFYAIVRRLTKIDTHRVFTFVLSFILILSITDILRFAWKNTPFSKKRFLYPETELLRFLINQPEPFRIAGPGIPLNYFMQYKISSAEGYDPIYPLRNAQWYSLVNFGDTNKIARRYGEISNYYSKMLNSANIKYLIDYKKNPDNRIISDVGVFNGGLNNAEMVPVFNEKRIYVFENKNSLPKVWEIKKYKVAENDSQLIELLNDNEMTQNNYVILEEDPKMIINEKNQSKINNINQGFNEIAFDITSEFESLIFVSESYNKDWRAIIDGEAIKIFRSNYLFQSIKVPAGEHQVRFIYEPYSFTVGKNVSIISLILLMGALVYEKKYKSKSHKST